MYKHLYRLAEMINDVFSQVIFIQFFVSILILCSIVYHLSSHSTFTDIATLIVYAFSMFVQIFVYCWAGNEVMLKVVIQDKNITRFLQCSVPCFFAFLLFYFFTLLTYSNLILFLFV